MSFYYCAVKRSRLEALARFVVACFTVQANVYNQEAKVI